MRIALVVTGGFDRSGREHTIPALVSFVEHLALEHDVVVYVLRYHATPVRYALVGATIEDLGSPRGIRRQYVALVAALRRNGPFDVIHGYWAVPGGLVAAAAGRRLGIPSVVTCDSGEFVAFPSIGYGQQHHLRGRTAVAIATRLAKTVVVASEHQASLARRHRGSPTVVPLGADTRVFTPGPQPPEGPPWRLLQVANLNPVKDQATLLRAFRSLLGRGVDAHLDVVGLDTMNGAVQGLAQNLGVSDGVTFHGFLPTEALAPLYRAAHLFVLTSLHEGAGVVLLEAAACGVPIVGSCVGHLADWAPDRATAVPPGSPAALADAIDALLQDRERRRTTAQTAQAWATAHDAAWSAREMSALYRRITAACVS